MCGIGAVISPTPSQVEEICQSIETCIFRRGPDHLDTVRVELQDDTMLVMSSAVLHLRGNEMCSQPRVDSNGNILLWNGEVFHGIDIPLEESDTTYVSNGLAAVSQVLLETIEQQVLRILTPIQGPFAFCWYHAASHTLFYGRDRWGRRSLVAHVPTTTISPFVLASVGINTDLELSFEEVECTGIFSLNLNNILSGPKLHPWLSMTPIITDTVRPLPQALADLPFDQDENASINAMMESAKGLLRELSHAVARRVESIPPPRNFSSARVGTLFSGGLDSVVIAALSHFHVPTDEPIDLLNVCFDPKRNSPDRKAALLSYSELQTLFPTRKWRFIAIDVEPSEVTAAQPHILKLMQPSNTHMDFNIGAAFWFLSCGKGVVVEPIAEEAKLLQVVPPTIFETASSCPANNCARKPHAGCIFNTCRPCCTSIHKLTAKVYRDQVHEQEKSAAKSKLIAMGINEDSMTDLDNFLSQYSCSELLKSNKESNAIPTSSGVPYISEAKVLLVGIGADEQVGGYGRHRDAYLRGGQEALRSELAMDMNRIWQRNLGRDDRMIADHGREARFPYLDEQVIEYLRSIPLEHVADFSQPRGIGDKLILRIVARQLGLRHCTSLAKQAIQFGTRIAKQSNERTGGKEKPKGTTAFNSKE